MVLAYPVLLWDNEIIRKLAQKLATYGLLLIQNEFGGNR